MPGTKTAMMALALSATLLGGCQSIFGSKLTVRPTQDAVKPGGEAAYAAAQLAEGRKALDAGNLSGAIAAFRNAKLDPDHAAPACNGLGVAYSQLGRPDLAERYFRQAIAMAPGEKRYQANLQHFYRLNPIELTVHASDKPALAAAMPAPAPETRMRLMSQAGTPTTVTVTSPSSRIVRLSAGEVRIGAAQPAFPPRAAAARAMAPVSVEKPGRTGASYPIKIGIARREVFVGQAAPRPAQRPPGARVAAKQQYPLKVEFKAQR